MTDPAPAGELPADPGGRASSARPLVAVVGGGISGLTAAWRLVGAGADVVVLEGRDRCGGALRRGPVGDVVVDLGAESVLARRPEAVALMTELGLGDDLVHPATATAAVASRGALHPVPPRTLMGVPGDPGALRGLLTDDEVARVAAEPGSPAAPLTEDVDVASYVAGRVGPAVVDRLVEPLLGGVYAGRASRLSLAATMPAVWAHARRGGSLVEAVAAATRPDPAAAPRPVFAGLRGGVGRLPEELAARLTARGARIRTRTTVRGLRRLPAGWRLELGAASAAGGAPAEVLDADAVVLAVPPPAAARLLADAAPAAAAEYAAIEVASVALVSAVVPAQALDGLTGSGILVPPVDGHPVKAATFASRKWDWVDGAAGPDLAVVRMSLGRAGETAVLQRDDDDLAALALADLGTLLDRPLPAIATRVTRWGGALPQYDVGHTGRVGRIRAAVAAAGPGLAVCGAALDGVGIPACVATATAAVADLGLPLEPLDPSLAGPAPGPGATAARRTMPL